MKSSLDVNKIALITESSTGLGFETALELARNGFYTYASMRNLNKSKKIKEVATSERLPLQVIELVNSEVSVSNAINTISKEKNRLDVVVNNAGYGLFGSLEDLSIDEIRNYLKLIILG
jgi:NADP-dependent 3-hydroxy acid dehydrogenase YdfG